MSVILPAAEVPGAAQETTSQDILTAVDGLEADIATIAAVDFATEAKQDTTNTKLDGIDQSLISIAAVDFALETTQQKLRKWPYANYDYTSTTFSTGTFTETVLYKSGGATGTTVGTITTVYSDISRGLPAATTYNPVKAV